ncbi:MAG: 4-alpha-glucanotransferase [Deltaproteobacteria bacterium]|nr:4-alpha-glucanotransferase [Deltaproteobacteria bacterium]
MREICIHGHFYQPTRVDPWTDIVDAQPSAAPFTDWNHRIAAECYAPNAAARLLDGEGRTRATKNTYTAMNFDFGPTLLSWLEKERPVLLNALRAADRDSVAVFGRGSAIAQPFHHPILPLCDDQDRKTEIQWGLTYFERIFDRPAEGIWLSETAVDTPTLETLVDHGVEFVILAPHQIEAIEDAQTGTWRDVSQHETANRGFRIPLPSGRHIVVVAYDSALSHAVAFDGLLHSGDKFANRLAEASKDTGFVLIGTDGESYGHHHPFGEMALAYAQEQLEARSDCRLTNVASWLQRNPPQTNARIREESSWSCAHGVGRWSKDCGCKVDSQRGWHQKWRGPFREALEGLRDAARSALANDGSLLFADPDTARNDYAEVIGRPLKFAAWYEKHAGPQADAKKARQWLEIHRRLLAMFTSCAWFFDEVTGLEPLQNIRLAAAAIGQLKTLCGVDLSEDFEKALAAIPGNLGTDKLVQTLHDNLTPSVKEAKNQSGISVDDRRAGVLQPISALGGPGPIGDLDGAIAFVDWLVDAGVGLWQVLPLVPTDAHGSPYSSWSTMSGNPDLVGLSWCIRAGLLPSHARLPRYERVDYDATLQTKRPLVLQAAQSLLDQPGHPWSADLQRFISTKKWAKDAALFYALKQSNNGTAWWTWPEAYRLRDADTLANAESTLKDDIQVWCAALFLFERQWAEVRSYAASRGIRLVGDAPIYVGQDSVDVWANQSLFLLDEKGLPERVAGVPPDAYSDTGQRWGNPLFNWDVMAQNKHQWWTERIERLLEHCDAMRVDHFIGFSRYWTVDASEETALNGEWTKGPGRRLFDDVEEALGPLPLIAEDLGSVDEGTVELRDALGLPGMRVLQFGLDSNPENQHHPDNHPELCVAYTSTHDSTPCRGWWQHQSEDEKQRIGLGQNPDEAVRNMVDMTLQSPAFWAIIPLQDLLGLGDEARMNQPGTVGGNWSWRQPARDLDPEIARDLRLRVRRSGRLVPQAFRSDSAPTIGGGARSGLNGERVAYFCMEYGLSHDLPIYSGGLGVLAGDIVKAASDQHRDFIAIGILWDEGYFVQDIDENGLQSARYVATPRHRMRPTGVRVHVDIGGESVAVTAWRVLHLGSVELLLLEPVAEEHRWITQRLYGGSGYDRVAQEVLLGVGGVRVLRELGIPIDVYHFNEGHALFAGFELLRENMTDGTSFEDAVTKVRADTVFTTHTPVPAGNEVHSLDRLIEVGANVAELSREQLIQIGGDPFQMTPAALRLSRKANAVAELHGETAREMWADVEGAAPIVAITNGVHMGTWQDAVLADHARRSDWESMWDRHQQHKRDLLVEIRDRVGSHFREDGLLIGFARRAATYKRATLLIRDRDWLESRFNNDGLQFVFAGKAHPHDKYGQAFIKELVEASRDYPNNLVFLPNYDMHLGALLTRGTDVWLNNPIRPKEASGTSGMKAAANGVLNLSILDGWWAEGCSHGVNGWGVDAPPAGVDVDQHDREALQNLVVDDVLAAYQDRDRWLKMMQASIGSASKNFSADRCVQRYFEELYGSQLTAK